MFPEANKPTPPPYERLDLQGYVAPIRFVSNAALIRSASIAICTWQSGFFPREMVRITILPFCRWQE